MPNIFVLFQFSYQYKRVLSNQYSGLQKFTSFSCIISVQTLYIFKNKFILCSILHPRTKHISMQTLSKQTNELSIANNLNVEAQIMNSNHLIYRTFATKAIDSFLGISVQKERLYVVQKKIICVFEYFVGYENTCTQKAPVLIKEILLPFEISKFIITEKYICIKSKNKTEIRDNEFEKVFYSENHGILIVRPKTQNEQTHNSNDFVFDTVEELELQCEIANDDMISWKVVMKKNTTGSDSRYLREYWSEKHNISSKHKSIIKFRSEMIDPSNKNRKLQICKSPLFINQLGYIQNFYIWPMSANDIQIGIYYNYKEHQNMSENHLYEICSFQLKQTHIKNIFQYNFKNTNPQRKGKFGPHLYLAVCENSQTYSGREMSMIKIVIFQIFPEEQAIPGEDYDSALNNCLDQFNQLTKQKKSQQSFSKSHLLNELMNVHDKSFIANNHEQPTVVIESFFLKNSKSLKKIFYNPLTNVLWINDASELVYRIKFLEQGNLKNIRDNNLSFIEGLEGFKNGQAKPDLEGIMYDNSPIFKVNTYNLEIGCRDVKSTQKVDLLEIDDLQNDVAQHDENQKEFIEFDDHQLEKIDRQKSSDKARDFKIQLNCQADHTPHKRNFSQIEMQTQHVTEQKPKPQKKLQKIAQQTQTQNVQDQIVEQQNEQKHININNLSELLKQLNFNKVEDVLMRFSQIFSGLVTKNINKLKDFNLKAKEEIKIKINSDIFELIKEVFGSLMGETLAQKIEKEVAKAREFVEKVFNKHIEHFNLMLIDEKAKQENIKKCILEEQLRSIDVIKEASCKFLDVTRIREMQKIAYNEVVVENIKEVGKKVQTLHLRLDEITRESEEMERRIIKEAREIKETFKLLIQLEENDSRGDQSEEVDNDECSEHSSGEEQDEEEEVIPKRMDKSEGFEDKGISYRHGVQTAHQYPFLSHHQIPPPFNERSPGWNSYYQPPPQSQPPYYPYPPQQPPYYNSNAQSFYPPPPPPPIYPPIPSSYSAQSSPYPGTFAGHQPSYFPPPPSIITPPYSQIRKGSQKMESMVKNEKKKNAKKGSSMTKND